MDFLQQVHLHSSSLILYEDLLKQNHNSYVFTNYPFETALTNFIGEEISFEFTPFNYF